MIHATYKNKNDKNKCRNPGSNQGPLDLQSNALPTELFRLLVLLYMKLQFKRALYHLDFLGFLSVVRTEAPFKHIFILDKTLYTELIANFKQNPVS